MRESQQREEQRQRRLEEEQQLRAHAPHLVNLHQDMMMAETVCYFFREGSTRVARPDADPPPGPNDIGVCLCRRSARARVLSCVPPQPCAACSS